jgi:hypothetical protein
MEMKFSSFKATITPLSPIHIGNGHRVNCDYMISVFHDKKSKSIYYFLLEDFINELSPDDRRSLGDYSSLDEMKINQLCLKHLAKIEKIALRKIGSSFDHVPLDKTNQHIFDPLKRQVYIPGSSIKGAIRTALSQQSPDFLKISIETDPFKYFKVSDAFFNKENPVVEIAKIRSWHKPPYQPSNKGYTPSSVDNKEWCETIKNGFPSTLTLSTLTFTMSINECQFKSWINQVNKFYLDLMEKEIGYIKNIGEEESSFGLIWLKRINDNLLKEEGNDGKGGVAKTHRYYINQGTRLLLRLGKYVGAESVTINHLSRNIKTKYRDKLPISMEFASYLKGGDPNDLSDIWSEWLPFGWVVINLNRV